MAMRLTESPVKAAEEAHPKKIQDLRKQMMANEAKFENELAQEKAARQRDKEKAKSR